MNTFNGRRGPNVSQYIANLNTIPSAHDIATQQQDDFSLEDDLALFTNTEFYDFDIGENIQQAPPVDYDPTLEERGRRGQAGGLKDNAKNLDFVNADYHFSTMTAFMPTDPSITLPASLQTNYPPPISPYATTTAATTSFPSAPGPGDKRPFDTGSSLSPVPSDDISRLAGEEDKRRRNTAASARFRVKKKQREQALEKAAKELSDKTSALETRISQLEMENRWLRNLVTEKTGKDDVAELWHKFRAGGVDGRGSEGRSSEGKRDGVGTEAEVGAQVEGEPKQNK